ncbi:hypothetical protein [Pedobacter gandavensis]|uniref:HD domain-containing protein n=1 Tax=Pedobacter gandavensis TaxID=2679963 RepID=UPI00292DDA56|nr:hypothetical protein [Pedobacter gandavensis]
MSKVISLKKIEDTTLYKELLSRENNKSIVGNIADLCADASERIKVLPKYFPEYTLHDEVHFLRVTELMSIIIGTKLKSLNDLEIWLLIMAAFYHDQGMVLDVSESQGLATNDRFNLFKKNWQLDHPNYQEIVRQVVSSAISGQEKIRLNKLVNELDAACLTDFLRINHGQRSADYINSALSDDPRASIYGINVSHLLANICLSHVKSHEWLLNESGLNFDDNIGNCTVNSIFLCIVLRLADILDFDADRTPDILFKSIHFTSPLSIQEWQKHRSVQGWEINKARVRFTMLFDHPVYEKTARTFMDWIDEELTSAQRTLRLFPKQDGHYAIDLPERTDRSRLSPKNNKYQYSDVEFTLSRNEIVNLLLTNNLYKNASLFIRELLQNSLDALRLRKALLATEGLDWGKGIIRFKNFIDENGDNVVECVDNGVGMDEGIIRNFLGKVGRSYYKSPEFEQLRANLQEKNVDFEPCSQFGIGFMSCFMIGDRIEILTRKDYGHGTAQGPPLKIEINGLGGLMIIRQGASDQPIGTSIKVFSRERKPIFDDWSDPIRLTTILQGVALANEFPIEATCEIECLQKSISITPSIDVKLTFLEKRRITSIVTIEIDLTTIHPDLHGFLRQSFLKDENGLPGFSSTEGYFVLEQDDNWKDERATLTYYHKSSGERKQFDMVHFENHVVCLDGILVCGKPGRQGADKYEMMNLGHLTSRIHSEHPFTIDVRGKIKPELNPAREPLENNSIFQSAPKWRQLQRLIDRASGELWEKVLEFSSSGLDMETFWQLLIAYDGSLINVSSKSLYKFIQFPNAEQQWIPVSSIDYAWVENANVIVSDYSGKHHTIVFPETITKYGKTHQNGVNFNYYIEHVIFNLCLVDFSTPDPVLRMRKYFEPNERPSSNTMSTHFLRTRYLSFLNLPHDYIGCVQYVDIANFENPIIRLSCDSHFGNLTDSLENYAVALTKSVAELIKYQKENNKPYTLDVGNNSLKYLGYKYESINWEKYDDKFKPPYKIFINHETTLEITAATLIRWSKMKL